MIFNFEKVANQNSFGLPREIKYSREDWYIFKAEPAFKPFFPRTHFTSLGKGWWYVNETGDYIFCCSDNTLLLYSIQKDSTLVVDSIYRFKEQSTEYHYGRQA